MDLESFQSTHGSAWAQITANPAWFAALQYADADTLKKLARLTPAQIKENGPEILAEYVGRLKLQNELLALSVPTGDPIDFLPEETYSDSPELVTPSVRSETFAPFKNFAAEFAAADPQPEQETVRKRGRPRGSKNRKKEK